MTRMPPPPTLRTGDLEIRLAEEVDADDVAAYYVANRAHLTPWEPTRPAGFYTVGFWRLQAHRNHEDYNRGSAVRFFIFHRREPGVVGYISFTNITRGAAHFCFLGYSLAEKRQGQGIMTRAIGEAVRWAFADLNLHRVMANHMPRNTRSAKLLARLGFEREGFAKEYLLINGRWEDHVMTALVNPNWQPETA